MKKFSIIALAALGVFGAGRLVYVNLVAVGNGQSLTSPSLRMEARASARTGSTFFGDPRDWSTLSVIDSRGRTLWETTVQTPSGALVWGGEEGITWAEDSASVTFVGTHSDGTLLEIRSRSFPPRPSADDLLDDG